jgi:acetyl esterase/lipase
VPDLTNVVYGSDPKFNVIDLWKAKSDKPAPLVIFIHGGGFGGGSKDHILTKLALDEYLRAGVSCASIDYRRLQSKPGPRQFIYPAIFLDCARAVQFLRYNAKEWNLDPTRFACAGGSAGAGMALWIGFHKDLADPKSDDPVARQSTRLTCVAVFDAQTSYDARWIKEHLPGKAFMTPNIHQLFGMEPSDILKPVPDYKQFNKQPISELLTPSPEKAKLMADGSPINHVTAEAPPVFIYYKGQQLKPRQPSDDIHQIQFGLRLKEKMDALKVECEIVAGWPQNPESTGPDKTDVEFVLRHFGIRQSAPPQKGEPQKGEPQKGDEAKVDDQAAARDREIRDLIASLNHMEFNGSNAPTDPKHRAAVEKLQKMSEHAAPAVAAMLAEGHKNRNEPKGWIQVYRPLYVLKGMGADAKVALPDVIKALDDTYGPVARGAAEVLENMGPAAKGAVPDLLRVWEKSRKIPGRPGATKALADALKKIDSEAAEKAGIK